MWVGRPYFSKQLFLLRSRCISTKSIRIELKRGRPVITMANRRMLLSDAHFLARGEGFADIDDMIAWFNAEHGLPFEGTLYRWAAISP